MLLYTSLLNYCIISGNSLIYNRKHYLVLEKNKTGKSLDHQEDNNEKEKYQNHMKNKCRN